MSETKTFPIIITCDGCAREKCLLSVECGEGHGLCWKQGEALSGPVKVGGKGTTHYYVPVRTEAVERLIEAAREYVEHGSDAAFSALAIALGRVEKEERDGKV